MLRKMVTGWCSFTKRNKARVKGGKKVFSKKVELHHQERVSICRGHVEEIKMKGVVTVEPPESCVKSPEKEVLVFSNQLFRGVDKILSTFGRTGRRDREKVELHLRNDDSSFIPRFESSFPQIVIANPNKTIRPVKRNFCFRKKVVFNKRGQYYDSKKYCKGRMKMHRNTGGRYYDGRMKMHRNKEIQYKKRKVFKKREVKDGVKWKKFSLEESIDHYVSLQKTKEKCKVVKEPKKMICNRNVKVKRGRKLRKSRKYKCKNESFLEFKRKQEQSIESFFVNNGSIFERKRNIDANFDSGNDVTQEGKVTGDAEKNVTETPVVEATTNDETQEYIKSIVSVPSALCCRVIFSTIFLYTIYLRSCKEFCSSNRRRKLFNLNYKLQNRVHRNVRFKMLVWCRRRILHDVHKNAFEEYLKQGTTEKSMNSLSFENERDNLTVCNKFGRVTFCKRLRNYSLKNAVRSKEHSDNSELNHLKHDFAFYFSREINSKCSHRVRKFHMGACVGDAEKNEEFGGQTGWCCVKEKDWKIKNFSSSMFIRRGVISVSNSVLKDYSARVELKFIPRTQNVRLQQFIALQGGFDIRDVGNNTISFCVNHFSSYGFDVSKMLEREEEKEREETKMDVDFNTDITKSPVCSTFLKGNKEKWKILPGPMKTHRNYLFTEYNLDCYEFSFQGRDSENVKCSFVYDLSLVHKKMREKNTNFPPMSKLLRKVGSTSEKFDEILFWRVNQNWIGRTTKKKMIYLCEQVLISHLLSFFVYAGYDCSGLKSEGILKGRNEETQEEGNKETQKLGNEDTQDLGNENTQGLGNENTQGLGNENTQGLGNEDTQEEYENVFREQQNREANVLTYDRKKGKQFATFDIPKDVSSGKKKPSFYLKRKIRSRFDRLIDVIAPIYQQILVNEKIDLPINITVEEPITGAKKKITPEGLILDFDTPLDDKYKWINDYCNKLLLNVSNQEYKLLTKLEEWTSMDIIYRRLKEFIVERQSIFRILNFVELNSEGKSVRRHGGIVLDSVALMKNFFEINPHLLADTLINTKEKVAFMKKECPCVFDTNNPCPFKEKRRFNTYKSGDDWICEATVCVGYKHDGAENFYNKSKVSGFSDRRCFEFGSLLCVDMPNSLKMSNYLSFFLMFADLTSEKFRQVGKDLKFKLDDLLSTTFHCELPNDLGRIIEPCCSTSLKIKLNFSLNVCCDQKAFKFYLDLENKAHSPRVNVLSRNKCRPYLHVKKLRSSELTQENEDEFTQEERKSVSDTHSVPTVPTVSIKDFVDYPKKENVIPFKDMYLCTHNIALLMKQPNRSSLRIPFEFNGKSKLLPREVSPISDMETDNLHGILSICRWFLTFLEKILRLFVRCKVLLPESIRKFYTFVIRKGIYQFDDIFVENKDKKLDFTSKFNLTANRNTIKAMKFRKLFDEKFLRQLFKDLRFSATMMFLPVFAKTEKLVLLLCPKVLSFCETLLKPSNVMLNDDEIRETAFNFDYFYVFVANAIQLVGFHSNYMLDWLNTLPVDLFFKRSLSINGLSTQELINQIIRKIINGNTSKFRNFGVWKLAFGRSSGEGTEKLDKFSNTALQVLLPLFSKMGNCFFGKKTMEIRTEKRNVLTQDSMNVDSKNVLTQDSKNVLTQDGEFRTYSRMKAVTFGEKKFVPELQSFYELANAWLGEVCETKLNNENKVSLEKPFNDEIENTLRDYQINMVNTLIHFYREDTKNLLLAWCPGVGKSLPIMNFTTCLANSEKKKISLVVAPSNMLDEWNQKFKSKDHLFNIFNHVTLVKSLKSFKNLYKKLKFMRKGKIIIVSYDVLKNFVTYVNSNVKNLEDWKSILFERIGGVFYDELHLKCQDKREGKGKKRNLKKKLKRKKSKDKFFSFLKKFKTEILQRNVIHVGITGTPFRNDSCFLNISDLLSNDDVEVDFESLRKKLTNVLKSNSVTHCNGVIIDMRNLFKGTCFVRAPSLKIPLHNIIVTFQPTDCQLKEYPSRSPNAVNDYEFHRISLDPILLGPENWKERKKKQHPYLRKRVSSPKFKFILNLLEMVYDNKIDFSYAKIIQRETVLNEQRGEEIKYQCWQFPDVPKHKRDYKVERKVNKCRKISDEMYVDKPQDDTAKEEKREFTQEKVTVDVMDVDVVDENLHRKNGLTQENSQTHDMMDADVVDRTNGLTQENSHTSDMMEVEIEKKFPSEYELTQEIADDDLLDVPSGCYEKVIIMSKYPSMLKQLKYLLCRESTHIKAHHFFSITGNETVKDRIKKRELFEDAKFAIALISTQVGGVGLTFTSSRYMIMLDSQWDHMWNGQALFRQYRFGQKRTVYNFQLNTQFLNKSSYDAEILDINYYMNGVVKNFYRECNNQGEGNIFKTSCLKDFLSKCILSPDGEKVSSVDVIPSMTDNVFKFLQRQRSEFKMNFFSYCSYISYLNSLRINSSE